MGSTIEKKIEVISSSAEVEFLVDKASGRDGRNSPVVLDSFYFSGFKIGSSALVKQVIWLLLSQFSLVSVFRYSLYGFHFI